MMDTETATLAVTFDNFEESNDVETGPKIWGRLVSLNPSCPSVDLSESEIFVGRQSSCAIRISDRLISGKHCRIFRESNDGLVFLEDLSSNGTWLNGDKIGKNHSLLLTNGAEITLIQKTDHTTPLTYIYQEVNKADQKKEVEEGGPETKYDVRETLGSGNFAVVKLCIQRSTGKRFAIKVIDKKKYLKHANSRKGSLMDEVNILKSVNHPNIIGIQEVFDTEKTLYIVLELVTGGELFDRIVDCGHFEENYAKTLFHQIVDAIHYLHSQDIVHRDLKPENILFANKQYDQLKLSDFGLSRTIKEGSVMQTMCGTPQYLAPEILTNTEQKGYSFKVDLWSLGAILFFMLCGNPPFDENKPLPIFGKITGPVINFDAPIWNKVSFAAKDLVQCLLTVDPAKRYDTNQIYQHPWLTGKGAAELEQQRKLEQEMQKELELQKQKEEEERLQKEVDRKAREMAEQLKQKEIEELQRKLLEQQNSIIANTNMNDATDEHRHDLKKTASQTAIKRKRSDEIMDEASNDSMDVEKNLKNAMQKTNSGTLRPPSRNASTNVSRSNSSGSLDGNQMDEEDKPLCMFGEKCYRKNPQHFKDYRHPWMNNKSSS